MNLTKIHTTLLLIFSVFAMLSCDFDIEENKRLKENSFFFSTDMFFEDEQIRLKETSGFTKFVNFNGMKETMEIDSLNFIDEFAPFQNSDINKAVWLDRYMCDTIYQVNVRGNKRPTHNDMTNINCSCQDKKLKTQKLSVDYKNGKVVEVRVENQMNKMLLTTMEYLTYTKNVSYEIKRVQMLETGGVDSTFVMVKF